MKKHISSFLSIFLIMSIPLANAFPYCTSVYADDGYTVHYFNAMEENLDGITKYSGADIAMNTETYSDTAGYGTVLAFTSNGSKQGINLTLDESNLVSISESNRYTEIEFDYSSQKAEDKIDDKATQMKFMLNDQELLNIQDRQLKIKFDSGVEPTYTIPSVKENLQRFKIVLRNVTADDGKNYFQMISVKINGKEVIVGGEVLTFKQTANDLKKITWRYGSNSTDTAYFDNISVVSYISDDGKSPVPDKYEFLSTMLKTQSDAAENYDNGVITESVLVSIKGIIADAENVFCSAASTNEQYNLSLENLNGVGNMINAYKYMKENDINYYVDAENTSVKGDFAEGASEVVLSVPVYTTVSETPVSVKILGFLYSGSNGLHTPKLIDTVSVENTINPDSVGTASVTLDSSGYTQYTDFSAKAVFLQDYTDITRKIPDVMIETNNDMPIGDGYSFLEDVNISKVLLGDTAQLQNYKIIFAFKGNEGSKISLLITKPNSDIDNIATFPKDVIEYYNTAVFDEKGHAVIEFIPSSDMGYYGYTINCSDYTEPKTGKVFFASISDINNIFIKLYDEKSMNNITEQQMDALSVNTPVYVSAVSSGVDIDSVLSETLGEKEYNAENLNEFTTSFMTKLDALKNFRTVESTDDVMTLINKYDFYIDDLTVITELDSKKRQTAYTYIYSNKNDIADMNTLRRVVKNAAESAKETTQSAVSTGSGSSSVGYVAYTANNKEENKVVAPVDTVMQKAKSMFSDLDSVSWAKTAILEFAVNNWIIGKEDGMFAPNDSITREEFVKIAVNAFGLYDDNAVCNFNDTSVDDWHYRYIGSALNMGLVNGITEDDFGTGKTITRQDMAVIIYRIAQKIGLQFTDDGEYIPFADEELISNYAAEAVAELAKSGIINGVGNNSFLPGGNATRAEAVKMLYEAYKLK